MQTPEALVQTQVDAYNRQDMAAFLACFHAEAEFVRWPAEVLLKGHDAFRQRYGQLWSCAPQLRAEITQRMVVGRFVTDLELLVGHPDGARTPVQVTYETEGGLIHRFWVITDQS